MTYGDREFDLQEVIRLLNQASSVRAVIRQLDLPVGGGSYRFLNQVIEGCGVDISRMPRQAWAAGLTIEHPLIRKRQSRMPPTRHRLKKAEKEALARQQQMEQA